jgi:hypothetical protein
MRKIHAINLATEYAIQCNIPWVRILGTERSRAWWYVTVMCYTFTVDTGDGTVIASVCTSTAKVVRFEYTPNDQKAWLLPLWVAYPTYNSMTSGWRQGYGEPYKYRWHAFYRSLSDEEKCKYRQTYSPPNDKERCWQGFYEFIADQPATGCEHSIAEFILGRVP